MKGKGCQKIAATGQVDLDLWLERLVRTGAVLRAEENGQPGAILQVCVQVPPFQVGRAGVDADAVLPLLDVATIELEARIVLGLVGQVLAGSPWVMRWL